MTAAKIKSLKQLKKILALLRKKGAKIIFTNGCFDILHLGHIRYLEQAKTLGDKLVVAVNSDRSVRRIKQAPRPIVAEKQRAAVLAALKCVDYVIIFGQSTPLTLIKALKPDVLVLCSLSPYFKEDQAGLPKTYIKLTGKRRIEDLKKYSFNQIASKVKSKVFLLAGGKEKVLLKRARKASKLLKCPLTVIPGIGHDIGKRDYLNEIIKLAEKI